MPDRRDAAFVPVGESRFATTNWSNVLAARGTSDDASRNALAELCESYWYPLYAFVRRIGYNSHDAQDVTQAFFARLLERDYLGQADRERGRFRSFLLASFKHFLAEQRRDARAQKRGGGKPILSLDFRGAESRYGFEPADNLTPEGAYERQWAMAVLNQALGRLEMEFERAGKGPLFARLKDCLTNPSSSMTFAETGAVLNMAEGTVKVAAHRLRRRYRELLKEEVARTIGDCGDIDDELRELFRVLAIS